MLVTIISILLSLSIAIIGLLMLLRNHKSRANVLFFEVCVLAAFWAVNFATIEQSYSLSIVSFQNALSFVLGAFLIMSVIVFTFYFPRERKKRFLKPFVLIYIPVAALSWTKLIAGTTSGSKPDYTFTAGTLSSLYILMMLLGVVLIIINLFSNRKSYSPVQRSQMQLVALGFSLSFIAGVGLSTLLPIFYPQTTLDNFSPFSIVFLILFTAVAVARYRLLDFRSVVIRAAGYIVTAILLSFIVSFGLLSIINSLLLSANPLSIGERILTGLLLVIGVLVYPWLKRLFDRVSRKIFFSNSYDTKEVLYKYNTEIVGSIDPDRLASIFIKTLTSTVQASKVVIFIEGMGIFSSSQSASQLITNEAVKGVVEYFSHRKTRSKDEAVLLDEIEGKEYEIAKFLQDSEFSLLLPINVTKNNTGFILVGHKQSGTLYSSSDLSLINILIKQLSLALNNAIQYSEISTFNITLTGKVENATKELRKTNEKLKALDEAKDEFISMASHQLRTPLTSVKGYVSMVLEGDAGKITSQQKKLLEQAFTSSQRMVYLIADLLNVSRLRTGKFVIETAPANLPEVIEGELQQLTETAKAHHLELSFDKPESFPILNLDETKTRQVIMNFMDNAIYYTPAGGHINVQLTASDKSVEFKVTDDGLGVPKAEQHHLFTKFYRAGNAKKARPDGTGLGLFMAQKVIIAQGGAIIFNSEEGKGSTFGFSFPRSGLEVKK